MESKRCARCGEIKLRSEYYKRGVDKVRSLCIICTSDRKKQIRNSRTLEQKQSESKKRRYRHVRRGYKLSAEEYENLLAQQDHKCAICLRPLLRLINVDHNHKTKIVRGLLCSNCNTLLGLAREEMVTLQRAISYLRGS